MPQNTTHLLEARNLALDYPTAAGPLRALEGISFSVKEGEFTTLVGPSGCGKSTLLRIIAGFIHPTEGEMLVQGEPITGPHHTRGVVFQQANLYPWLSARSNVEFGLKARDVPKAEREATSKAMLELVGLWEVRDRFPYELSGGMQQRISIARSLANRPAILLMDEPFSALDEFTRRQLQDELKAIWRKSKQTVVFITHNVAEAIYLSTTVLVMASGPGRIVERVTPPFSTRDALKSAREVQPELEFIQLQNRIVGHIESTQLDTSVQPATGEDRRHQSRGGLRE